MEYSIINRKEGKEMIVSAFGKQVRIPRGYKLDSNENYINGHGVEYALVKYGWKENETICLETLYSKHTRTIALEEV